MCVPRSQGSCVEVAGVLRFEVARTTPEIATSARRGCDFGGSGVVEGVVHEELFGKYGAGVLEVGGVGHEGA